jgi:hypothetical protein
MILQRLCGHNPGQRYGFPVCTLAYVRHKRVSKWATRTISEGVLVLGRRLERWYLLTYQDIKPVLLALIMRCEYRSGQVLYWRGQPPSLQAKQCSAESTSAHLARTCRYTRASANSSGTVHPQSCSNRIAQSHNSQCAAERVY